MTPDRIPEMTATQAMVFQIAGELGRHFQPEEIQEVLRKRRIRMSRATLYRALEYLIRTGLVRRHSLDANSYVYEIMDRRHHDHMICIRCGAMIEFRHPRIEAVQARICEEQGFRPLTHSLYLLGYCRRCYARMAPI